jgi:DNA-binding GntR family transcriptional regulator
MCSQRFSKEPAHVRVRNLLAQKIAAGEWDVGGELPSACALARQLGVSCVEIRNALTLLERECAVIRKRDGTFVAAGSCDRKGIRVRHPGGGNSPVLPEIESTPIVEDWADEAECVRLHLRSTDRVFRTRRIHFTRGLPFMAERTTVAGGMFPGLADKAFPTHGILDLARIYGIALGMAHEQASIAPVSAEAADVLGLEEGSLGLLLDRVVTTRDGQPAEWRVAECRLTRQQMSAL